MLLGRLKSKGHDGFMVRCKTICPQIRGKFTLCLMALILNVLIFCELEYNWNFHIDASGSKLDFFSSFLVIKKMGTSGEGTKFQCKSDQYSSVAIFTDFANL